MSIDSVASSILSLVQHVELNRAGWWDRTVQQFVLAKLFDSASPVPLDVLCDAVNGAIGRGLERGYLESQIRQLERGHHIVELPSQGLALSEAARDRVRASSSAIAENERAVWQRFREEVETRHLDVEPKEAWDAFLACALKPMVNDLGARTYQVIAGGDIRQDTTDYLHAFLQRFPEPMRPGLGEVAIAVMDPRDASMRAFILRLLNARFVVEAAGLRRDVLEELARSAGRRSRTLLFVDTNFLFSLLQLHANPANEAAGALLGLLRQVADFVDVRLYVLPSTVDEARIRIGREIDSLRNLVLTPKLAQAVRQGELSGLAQRYAEEIARGTVRLKPAEFFGPYHDDLLTFARAR